MIKNMIIVIFSITALTLGAAQANDDHGTHGPKLGAEQGPHIKKGHSPHHLSIINGGTTILEDGRTAYTVGIDYEYRYSDLLGFGFVAEQAVGNVDAFTFLAVADIHIWKGLAIQVGPGLEFTEEEDGLVFRSGVLYEFEFFDHWTLSPQAHFDFAHEDSFVFGIAIGRSF